MLAEQPFVELDTVRTSPKVLAVFERAQAAVAPEKPEPVAHAQNKRASRSKGEEKKTETKGGLKKADSSKGDKQTDKQADKKDDKKGEADKARTGEPAAPAAPSSATTRDAGRKAQ
jgi:hypothetical protein